MCPTFIVLTDSHYVPATDTLTGIGCKDTKKGLCGRKNFCRGEESEGSIKFK